MSPFLDKLVRSTYGNIQAKKQSNENFKQPTGKKVLYELYVTSRCTLDIRVRWAIINFNYSLRSGNCLIGASAAASRPKVMHDCAELNRPSCCHAEHPDGSGRRAALRHAMLRAMNAAELLSRIAPEPGKMGGKPVIRGRRITPAMVLNMLANGASRKAVLEACPVLEPEDIDACLLYAHG